MPVIPFNDKHPKIGSNVFIAPDAWVIGDVEIGDNVSIFFGSVLRGDILPIRVGNGTNIQEHSMLHTSHDLTPCLVGSDVTVGHRVILHGCAVEDGALIGMGATVLDGAKIGRQGVVAAQSLVPMNMQVPELTLVAGIPAKVKKEINSELLKANKLGVEHYKEVGLHYAGYFGSKKFA